MNADAARMRVLAALTIRAQDDERARVARELHDSTAQSIAALAYQLAAAARDCTDPGMTRRLHEMRELAGNILEEVGEQDITTHVNFSLLIAAGESAGVKTEQFVNQGVFLKGILEQINRKPEMFPLWTAMRYRQLTSVEHTPHR